MEMLRTETMYKTNTSGVRGVYYSTKRNKWIAQIMFKKKCYYLGGYDRLEDAAKVRAEAEEKIFGNFLKWYQEKYPDKKKETGQNFMDYLTELRINESKALLCRNDLSVQDVAEAVGYRDLKYFSRLFKKITGVSPSDYRKLYR